MLRRLFLSGLPAALLLITSSQDTSAADACISQKTVDCLSSCAGITSAPVKARRQRERFASPVAPPKSEKDLTKPPPPTTGPGTAKEIRRKLATVRGTQLLVTEIQGLEALLGSTPRTSPDR